MARGLVPRVVSGRGRSPRARARPAGRGGAVSARGAAHPLNERFPV